MPRRRYTKIPKQEDFSPTEVANLGLLGIKRAAIYRHIQHGAIKAVEDEFGNMRITRGEIERVRRVWHLKGLPPFPGDEKDNELLLLQQAMDRARRAAGGHMKAARHSRAELAADMERGRREALREKIDPEHKLFGDELERCLEEARLAQIRLAQHARWEKALRNKQHGHETA